MSSSLSRTHTHAHNISPQPYPWFRAVLRALQHPTTHCNTRQKTTNGAASSSRPLNIIGLFCKSDLEKRRYSAKESYDFKEPTNRRHNIPPFVPQHTSLCTTTYLPLYHNIPPFVPQHTSLCICVITAHIYIVYEYVVATISSCGDD